jgi:shikimate kinase
LGGGVVLRPENRELLCGDRGVVVWLKASSRTLWKRISADSTTATRRPKLTALGGFAEIQVLLDQREPFYQQCADFTVDTEGKLPQDVAKEILQWWRNREKSG